MISAGKVISNQCFVPGGTLCRFPILITDTLITFAAIRGTVSSLRARSRALEHEIEICEAALTCITNIQQEVAAEEEIG